MTPTERSGDRRVELFARARLPRPAAHQRTTISERLAALEAAGTIRSASVTTWNRRIRCDADDAADRRHVEAFWAWARERGVELTPFFDTRECYSMETGEKADWIVLPALCLAVYDDDDLVSVFPHADGDSYCSVADGVAALERRSASTAREGPDGETEPALLLPAD